MRNLRLVCALLGFLLSACAGLTHSGSGDAGEPVQQAVVTNPLAGTRWKLVRVGAQAVPANPDLQPFIAFDAQGQIFRGLAICNQMSGVYRVAGDRLDFSDVVATQLGCAPGPVSDFEVLAVLDATARFAIQGKQLALLPESGEPLALYESLGPL
jgi:heat shock protein HslJ